MTSPTYRRRDDALWRKVPTGILVLPVEREMPSLLAGTAAAIWESLESTPQRSQLTESLARRYATDPEVIARDVDAALREFVDLGLLAAHP